MEYSSPCWSLSVPQKDAGIANLSADRAGDGMVVTSDLPDPDNGELVRDVAEEHGFEQDGETGERFESVSP